MVIFLKVHRSATSYSADRSLSPWIFTIVVNTTRSHLRKVGVRKVVEQVDSLDDVQSTIVSAARLAEAKETADFMQDEILDGRIPITNNMVELLLKEN